MISISIPVPLPPLLSIFSPSFLAVSHHCRSTQAKTEICWVWRVPRFGNILTSCGNVSCSQRVPSWQALFWAGIPPAPSVTPRGLVVMFGLECKVSSRDISPEHLIPHQDCPQEQSLPFPSVLPGCLCCALIWGLHTHLLIPTSSLFHIPTMRRLQVTFFPRMTFQRFRQQWRD